MDCAPSIKIIVSGHKACARPSSALYVPVQVGAANTDIRLDGMIPDNQGDNISPLNGSFSELTAQYWAWRNTESDFVGACHYRRYFCFDGLKHSDSKNDHMQIEVDRLCPGSISEYNLDNDELIRKAISSYDAIVPEEWDVGTTETPRGIKTNVREHMKGYGLVKDDAFDLLEKIVNERFPEYAVDFHDYLYGKMYLGYSCFVMRRELFDRLCAFEFDVLMDFVNLHNDPDRTSTQMRLGGFLGEILFSTFILHIKRSGASIAHYPLVFFSETDPLLDASAENGTDVPVHHVIWDTDGQPATAIGVCVKSLFDAIEGDDYWSITLALSEQGDAPIVKRVIGSTPDNVTLRCITKPVFETRMLGPLGKSVMDRNPEAGAMCLAPWLFEQWDDVLLLQNAVLFNKKLQWSYFTSAAARKRTSILAARDVCVSAVLNCGENPVSVQLAEKLDITARCLHDYSVCYMNLSMRREENDQDEIASNALQAIEVFETVPQKEKTRIDKIVCRINQAILTNAVMMPIRSIDLPFAHFFPLERSEIVSAWCYADVSSSWAAASATSASVVFYTKTSNPLEGNPMVDNTVFWRIARTSTMYEQLLVQQIRESLDAAGVFETTWKNTLFPVGTKRRAWAKRSLSVIRKLRPK